VTSGREEDAQIKCIRPVSGDNPEHSGEVQGGGEGRKTGEEAVRGGRAGTSVSRGLRGEKGPAGAKKKLRLGKVTKGKSRAGGVAVDRREAAKKRKKETKVCLEREVVSGLALPRRGLWTRNAGGGKL